MVALIIALNILLCKFIAACIQIDTNVTDLMAVTIIVAKDKIVKTTKQVFREIDNCTNINSTGESLVGNVLLKLVVFSTS